MFITSLVIIFHKFQIYAVPIKVIHWGTKRKLKNLS